MERDLSELLATPIIWTPNQEIETWEEQVDRMFIRSQAVNDMLAGLISWEDFLDVLNDHYIDVDSCLDDWEEGKFYI